MVLARGSGQPQDIGDTFLELQKDMTLAAKQARMSYRITDLDYEAIAITPGNALGIYVSAGQSYSFGKSVAGGVKELKHYAKERMAACPNTYWVLAGYSQGAMVVQDSLEVFDLNKIAYVMYFGDPKLYLPEGEGFNPPACHGDNLSEYRVYVPDCDTDNGILGARKPYVYSGLTGRFGLWCNDDDFICGSSKNPLNTGGHSLYEENGSIYNASMYALKHLKALRRTGVVKSSEDEASDKLGMVLAQFSQSRYDVDLGEEITFDASRSFDVDDAELEYVWTVAGRAQEASGSYLSYVFKNEGMYSVRVEVRNAAGDSSFAETKVRVGWNKEESQPLALLDIYAERCGDKRICVSWTRKRGGAQYLGLRINDYFLGYVDVANEGIVIDDVDFSDINLAMGPMNADYDLGKMTELKIEGIAELVVTSATLPWWQILAIAGLPFGFILLIRVAIKFGKDLVRVRQ